MPTFITFELTSNSKAIQLKTNDLSSNPSVDYKRVVINLEDVGHLVEEENPTDGVNVILVDGTKYTILPYHVSMIGVKTYPLISVPELGGGSFEVCPDNETLLNDLIQLIGW